MKTQIAMLLSVIVLVPGCGGFRSKKKVEKKPHEPKEMLTAVDIPVTGEGVRALLDEELDELVLTDTSFAVPVADENQYAWINESDKKDAGFKKIYFDFDRYSLKSSEKEAVDYDIARMKQLLAQEARTGNRVQFVINGNSDNIHAAHAETYNRILSEKRAKTLKDYAVAQGVPADRIKIVGRGDDFPEIVNGKPCGGNKEQQALNRRDEIQVVVMS